MAGEDVSVIALVENLELAVPHRLIPSANSALKFKDLTTKQTDQQRRASLTNIIGFKDHDSQITKRHLNFIDVDKTADNVENKSEDATYAADSLEILRRLPPGTVLIKQVEDDVTKNGLKNGATTSTHSITDRIRRLAHPQRSRNKKTLEVRRNPLRSAARKDLKGSARVTTSRQRLLAGRRKAAALAATSDVAFNGSLSSGNKNSQESNAKGETVVPIGKRSRTGNYMNTRSVTRKMHNVGAIYEAPTSRDYVEWKEWPAHGMHERPVYHPQFGLVVEFNNKVFASFDGEGYRELGSADALQVESVRVDPQIENFDSSVNFYKQPSFQGLSTVTSQYGAAVSAGTIRPKLGYGSMTNGSYVRPGVSRLSGLFDMGPRLSSYEPLNSNYGLTPQQQIQAQHLERLHQIESLGQRIQNARAHLPLAGSTSMSSGRQHLESFHKRFQNYQALLQQQQSSSTSTNTANQQLEFLKHRIQNARARLQQHPSSTSTSTVQHQSNYATSSSLSKEMFKNLQNAGHAQSSSQQSPSKCLITPRASVSTPVTMPFCSVQAVNKNNKVMFVSAPDVPKKPLVERTSTITSSTQSISASWNEKNLWKNSPLNSFPSSFLDIPAKKPRTLTTWSKKLDSSPMLSTEESLSMCSKSRTTSNKETGSVLSNSDNSHIIPQLRQLLSGSIYRPNGCLSITPKIKDDPVYTGAASNGLEFGYKSSVESKEDHLSEVLDLSKKEPLNVKLEEAKVKDDKNVPQKYATDLVHYFQNFGADENIDMFEDSKNLT